MPSLRGHIVGVGDYVVCSKSTASVCVDDIMDFMSSTCEKKINCFDLLSLCAH